MGFSMDIVDFLSGLSRSFPPFPLPSRVSAYSARFGAEPPQYLSLCFLLPLIPALLISILFISSVVYFAAAFLLVYSFLALLVLFLPKLAFEKKRSEIEAELPLFLRTLSMLLELSIPFHRALSALSRESFAISPELKAAVKEVDRGATLESSLASLARRMESLEVKRAVSQVISSYESGSGAAGIRKISDDLFFLQHQKMKEFSSKQALLSLLFIAVSTILPAVFLIFSVLGASVFESPADPVVFALTFLLGFPAVSAAILKFSSMLSPAYLKEGRGQGMGIVIPFVAAIFLVGLSLLELSPLVVLLVLLLLLVLAVTYFYPQYKREKYREAVERGIPDALLSVSGNSKIGRIDSLFSTMARSSNPQLSHELSISLKQLRANIKPAKVLDDLWRRNSSSILRRVSTFFTYLVEAGADTGAYLSLMAEDIFRLFELRGERRNALSMQKYTLIFGAFILPLVLGNSLSLISGISASLGGLGAIIETAGSVIPAYLLIYCFLASGFIGETESSASSGMLYFAGLSLASTILFYLFSGIAGV